MLIEIKFNNFKMKRIGNYLGIYQNIAKSRLLRIIMSLL